MSNTFHPRIVGLTVPAIALGLSALAGCSSSSVDNADGSQSIATGPAPSTTPAVVAPAPGKVRRVGGDMTAAVERKGEFYSSGTASITTELPDGYPEPTPPGAIDLKTYPSIRRAEVSGTSSPDVGMQAGFFPLFGHISRRKIAMTSPVEVDYTGWSWRTADATATPPAAPTSPTTRTRAPRPEGWTMSFLYRRPDLGPTGTDESNERIKIVDTAPVTVVAIGWQGDYSMTGTAKALAEVEAWLAKNPEWEIAGEPRSLYYNGPEKRANQRWAEAQVPVRPARASR